MENGTRKRESKRKEPWGRGWGESLNAHTGIWPGIRVAMKVLFSEANEGILRELKKIKTQAGRPECFWDAVGIIIMSSITT